MKLLADECCDAARVASLRAAGHDVLYAVESMRGRPDEEILNQAYLEKCILLTEDTDFELVYRLRKPAYGVVLLQFDEDDRLLKTPLLCRLLEQEEGRLPGAFVVLEIDKIRIRPF